MRRFKKTACVLALALTLAGTGGFGPALGAEAADETTSGKDSYIQVSEEEDQERPAGEETPAYEETQAQPDVKPDEDALISTVNTEDGIYSYTPASEEVNKAAASPLNRLSFVNDDLYTWGVVEKDGRKYVQSGNGGISDSSSTLSLTVTLKAAGSVSFDYKAWGESSTYNVFDECIFAVDGTPYKTWGAEQNDWRTETVSLGAGTHVLSWSYKKDGSMNPPGDFFAVDNVKISELAALNEALNIDGGELFFENDPVYPYTVETVKERLCAVSGNKGVEESRASVQTTVTLDDYYDLSFYYRVYSFGDVEFYIDDNRKWRDSFESDWTGATCLVPPGTHTLKWSYYRSSYTGNMEDRLCLADISFSPPVKPTGIDAEDMTIALNMATEIEASILPYSSNFREMTLESDDPSVVRVEGYQLIAYKTGTAHVTISSTVFPDINKTITVTVQDKGVPKATLMGDYRSDDGDDGLRMISSVYPEEALCTIPFDESVDASACINGKVYGYSDGDYFSFLLDAPEEITWYRNVLPMNIRAEALAYNSKGNCFYGVFLNSGDDTYSLMKILPETGVPEKVSDFDLGTCFAVDSMGNGWALYDYWLYRVDLSTGNYVKQAQLSSYGWYEHIVIDPVTDEMFGLQSGGSEGEYLYWIDRREFKGVKLGYVGHMKRMMLIPDESQSYDPSPFRDVKDPSKYWYQPVLWAYYADPQITAGKNPPANDLFMPKDNCTRAEVVTFLWRLAGCPEPLSAENPFSDVKHYDKNGKEIYYYRAVLWALGEGITSGTTDTTFDPKGICTRAEFVTFLWRTYGMPELESYNSPFTDVQNISKYWFKPVIWAVENGITSGTGDGTTFTPKGTLTRRDVVTFIYRGFAKLGRP